MKKTITIIIGLFAIMCISSSAHAAAASWTQAAAGGGLTVGETASAGAFSFAPSPGVLINGASDLTVYCILSGNAKAGADAIVYNVWSAGGQVAQLAVDLSGAPAAGDLGTPDANGGMVGGFVTK